MQLTPDEEADYLALTGQAPTAAERAPVPSYVQEGGRGKYDRKKAKAQRQKDGRPERRILVPEIPPPRDPKLLKNSKQAKSLRDRPGLIRGEVNKALPQIIAMLIRGDTVREIAEGLKLQLSSVRWALYKARRKGILQHSGSDHDRLENVVKPLVIDNIITFLEGGDKEVTLTAADRLVWPAKSAALNLAPQGPPPLQINIVTPQGSALEPSPQQLTGRIHGRPNGLPAHEAVTTVIDVPAAEPVDPSIVTLGQPND